MEKYKAKNAYNPETLSMVSLFAGIGGFELGFRNVGIKTIMSCEIDRIASYVLSSNFHETEIVPDICTLSKLPQNTDILCAGFPCQDLSSIGVKKGLEGERSSLVKQVFRLLQISKPEWVIFENVPYMLRLKKGETIKIIVDSLESLGYDWAYRVVNSLSFVPQHRPRVYIVASLHNNPMDVLLSEDSNHTPSKITITDFTEPCGFYWTEGKYALGLYQNGIPTLKVGSSIGIPSAPAIAFPNGNIASPDIRDAERFQGFPADWTKSAEEIAKPSSRWKLVGNAVTVNIVEWIANKLINPIHYESTNDKPLYPHDKWPNSAYSINGQRFISNSSSFPIYREDINLSQFLQFPCKPLSLKAITGFIKRMNTGTVKCPSFFHSAINNYLTIISESNA